MRELTIAEKISRREAVGVLGDASAGHVAGSKLVPSTFGFVLWRRDNPEHKHEGTGKERSQALEAIWRHALGCCVSAED